MSNNLSADTLFHFTKSIENILGILSNEFKPRYNVEDWQPIIGQKHPIVIPMVCFCDIPLSQIQKHTEDYGEYAIGLSKKWGISKKINPVLYTYHKSGVTSQLKIISEELANRGLLADEVTDRYLKVLQYLKPYEGHRLELKRCEIIKGKKIKFYNEREWRFIPEVSWAQDRIHPLLYPQECGEETLYNENEKLKTKKLSFEPKDIKYIIVKKENEVLDIAKSVQKIKGSKGYSQDELLLLTTKIMSLDQIRSDF
jgi:hypothetical protein